MPLHVLIFAGPKSWSYDLDPRWLEALLDMAKEVDGRPWVRGQAWEKESTKPAGEELRRQTRAPKRR